MPPQSGMYNMAPPQPMSNNQFGSMGPGVPGAASMPPGGYQPDGQGSGVMGQPNFPAMVRVQNESTGLIWRVKITRVFLWGMAFNLIK